MLLDSNVIIYASKPGNLQSRSARFLLMPNACISAITYIETLGYHKLLCEEKRKLQAILGQIHILPINDQIVEIATTLRQERPMSLGDAVIAATAIHFKKYLVTANIKDFNHMPAINLVDLRAE